MFFIIKVRLIGIKKEHRLEFADHLDALCIKDCVTFLSGSILNAQSLLVNTKVPPVLKINYILILFNYRNDMVIPNPNLPPLKKKD